MPRRMRVFRQNCVHHVMMRGVNGHEIFRDRQDYVRFCLILQAACEKHKLQVHAFCLMTNHIHLAIEPTNDEFHTGIHAFSFRYAQYFNKRHDRRGYLFQGRYKSIIVDGHMYLKRLIRYIHRNPIEARLVEHAEHYPWSSYTAYTNRKEFLWLKKDHVLHHFGSSENAVENLKLFTNLQADADQDGKIIWDAHRNGSFDKEIPIQIIRQETKLAVGPKNVLSAKAPHLPDVSTYICAHFDVDQKQLVGASKVKNIVNARSALALTARRTKWWSLEEVSALLQKNSGTMSRLASRAESSDILCRLIEQIKANWEA